MRLLVLIATVGLGLIFSACPTESRVADASQPAEAVPGDRSPVLVELFTSEGCSSCPPADKELAFLERQQPISKADIITLAFHVDYWDHLGWKDRFSSPLFSRRQENYSGAFHLDSNYTPQMIVDGKTQFVGSDAAQAAKEIQTAVDSPKAVVAVSVENGRVSVKVTNAPSHKAATVFAAIAEDDIKSRVERGENSGMNLEHVSVVRELKTVGELSPDKNVLESTTDLATPSDSNSEKLKVVVFVQEDQSRKVIGAARASFKK